MAAKEPMSNLAHYGRFARNRAQSLLHPGDKIFFIGFNKCATTALHHLLRKQGVDSIHHKVAGTPIGPEIEARVHDPVQLRSLLRRHQAYSDLTGVIDGKPMNANRHFGLFHELFPDAYFVLNDRNPDAWIRSKAAHGGGRSLRNWMQAYGLSAYEVMARWRQDREELVDSAVRYFADTPRFIHFRVDSDPILRLLDHLAPTFALSPSHWHKLNARKRKHMD